MKKINMFCEFFEVCDFIVVDEISMIDGKTFDIFINRLKDINQHKEALGNNNLIIAIMVVNLINLKKHHIHVNYEKLKDRITKNL